jgi:hypothetical protein
VAAGGPFALSHGPPGASTAHLMGAPGGGSGHFSSVSALRAKKQPSAQPQGGSAIVVSVCAMLSKLSVLRLILLSSMHLMWTAKFVHFAKLVTLQAHCLFTLPLKFSLIICPSVFFCASQKIVEKGMVAFMTHPLMVLAVTMVTDPLYYGQNW